MMAERVLEPKGSLAMNEEHTVLLYDLLILEEMAANMDAYLVSDARDWIIPRSNMPKLTIGGYLMRQHRLLVLENALGAEDAARLRAAIKIFDAALLEKVVRFENRAHQELHSRIGEWVSYLRDLGSRSSSEVNYYAGIVDTRVVIASLIDKLQEQPYKLEKGVLEELDDLDKNLRVRLADYGFVWDTVWMPAYPQKIYWWLYGCPRHAQTTVPKQ
jgi:hypothetical protein